MEDRQRYKVFLKEIADRNRDIVDRQGWAEPGHNGPYGHRDTPARNTAHWCITYGYLWKEFGEPAYYRISRKLADYLVKLQSESVSGAVQCMYDSSYNHINGLMGQAWVIEALVYFYSISKDQTYLDCAEKIFRTPQYNHSLHMWEMIELDGRNIGPDYVFNHQLWFAASGSLILEQGSFPWLRALLTDYLDGCMTHLQVHRNGLIRHYGDLPLSLASRVKGQLKRAVKLTVFRSRRRRDPDRYDVDGFERGYHLFNLYAFAILEKNFGSHALYSSKAFLAALDYGRRTDVNNDFFNVANVIKNCSNVTMNRYAYAYNSPAFEYPYIYHTFGDEGFEDKCEELFRIQLAVTYDERSKGLCRHTDDPKTLTARAYELVRFLECK